MKRYELKIGILDKAYLDSLIVALVRQGNNVYYNDECDCKHGAVYIEITDLELTELKDK